MYKQAKKSKKKDPNNSYWIYIRIAVGVVDQTLSHIRIKLSIEIWFEWNVLKFSSLNIISKNVIQLLLGLFDNYEIRTGVSMA